VSSENIKLKDITRAEIEEALFLRDFSLLSGRSKTTYDEVYESSVV
jgi:hypothetical protein